MSLGSWRDVLIYRIAQVDPDRSMRSSRDVHSVGWEWDQLTPLLKALPPDPWVAEIFCQIAICARETPVQAGEELGPWVHACHALSHIRPKRYRELLDEAQCPEGTSGMERLVREYRPP